MKICLKWVWRREQCNFCVYLFITIFAFITSVLVRLYFIELDFEKAFMA